jgi:hypothetical protein
MEKNLKDSGGMKDQRDQKTTTGSSYTPSSKNTGNTVNQGSRKEPIDRGNKTTGENREPSRDKAETPERK